jgi:hypothetical protein
VGSPAAKTKVFDLGIAKVRGCPERPSATSPRKSAKMRFIPL